MAPNGSQRLPTAPYDYKHTLLLFSSSMTPTDFHRLPPRELTPQPLPRPVTRSSSPACWWCCRTPARALARVGASINLNFTQTFLKKYAPKIVENCKECLKESKVDLDFLRLDRSFFSKCPDISIDIAVFENTKKAYVLPMDCGWDDIGNWESLWNISKKDLDGNAIKGKVIVKETHTSLIRSEDKLLVCLGLKDLMIIDDDDATLVVKKGYEEQVKDVLEEIKKIGHSSASEHTFENRPWGKFENILDSKICKVKKLTVNPSQHLSLQYHKKRSEHWIVVEGKASVNLNDKNIILKKGESIDIPLGARHSLGNDTKEVLIVIEVQLGIYFGEDDIIRINDSYNR